MANRGYGEPMGSEYGASNRDRDRGDFGRGRDRDEDRGFFERAGEEIRSWFSDDDDRNSGRDYDRNRERGQFGQDRDRERQRGSSWGESQNRGGYGRTSSSDWSNQGGSFGDNQRHGQGSYGQTYGRSSFEQGRDRGQGSSRAEMFGSRPDRSERFTSGRFGDQQGSRSQGSRQSFGSDRQTGSQSESGLGYEDYRGQLGGFGNQRMGSSQDDHYRSWRDRQMQQLDRDYEEYCRDCEQRFHQDFDSWRQNRQQQSGQNRSSGQTGTTSQTSGSTGMGSAAGGSVSPSDMTSGTSTGGGSGSAIGGGTGGSTTGTTGSTSETDTTGAGGGRGGRSR